jgi:TrmH family RNA methyltransferase
MLISSLQNSTVKRLVALRGKRRERAAAGVTLVEGYDEIRVALEGGARVREVLWCRELMGDRAEAQIGLVEKLGSELTTEMTREVFEKVAYREGPDGWLAVVDAPSDSLDALELPGGALVLVCEAIEKPGNLGAMLRTADAAGADAVVAVDPRADWGNPNVVRASKGTVFTVPVATTNLERFLDWARIRGLRVVAATPEAKFSYTDADLTGGVAIAVGAEHEGLTKELMAAADARVLIPMVGQVNSLNVATSAALLLYEAVRQRKA